MPSFTPADALITAADNLVDTINGIIPKHTVTSDAVEQLMEIYKIQAEKATCEARTQRVLREQAQAQLKSLGLINCEDNWLSFIDEHGKGFKGCW